jgi:hypothetical protein
VRMAYVWEFFAFVFLLLFCEYEAKRERVGEGWDEVKSE